MSSVQTPRRAVAPNAIPDALRAIWNECCDDTDGSTVSRALTQNLVAVADAAREAELRQVVEALAARLPCRAFLAIVHPGEGAIAAKVHGAARRHGKTRDLVLEQIELTVPQAAFAQVAGVVRPLLVNDIPTHCYWATSWPRNVLEFDALAKMADHTVVDSSRFAMPAGELDELETRRGRGVPIADLAWLRLRPWRRAMAEVLERTGYLAHAQTAVTVRHGESSVSAAALLARWLEQRLAASACLENLGAAGSGIDSVELRHGAATATASLFAGNRIRIEIETDQACFVPFFVPASRGSEADLLAAAIDLA